MSEAYDNAARAKEKAMAMSVAGFFTGIGLNCTIPTENHDNSKHFFTVMCDGIPYTISVEIEA